MTLSFELHKNIQILLINLLIKLQQVQQFLKQEGPIVVPKAFVGHLGITITRELGAAYDTAKNTLDSIPGALLDVHRIVGSWMGASDEIAKCIGEMTEHTNNHDGVGFAACFEGLRQELGVCKRRDLPKVPCYDQSSRRLQ